MATTKFEEMRIKQRFSVNLKAEGSLAGRKQQFLISNLSATGARLHFETGSDISPGMNITLVISIPGTILKVETAAEIIWVTRQHHAVSIGVRFKDTLSETMVQQLVKKN